MIRFIIKGLIRDKHRSLLPVIVVALGVMLTVLMHSWITGIMSESIDFNAKFSAGHVKIMTSAYADNSAQKPNDLALVNVDELKDQLNTDFPDMIWADRINFGGLIDVPDETGETRIQGPAMGIAVDLLSDNTREISRLNLNSSIVQGSLPSAPGEILISDEFAGNLGVKPGDQVSLISSTMFGSMAIYNFIVSGTVQFGTRIMDRGAIIVDIQDARKALDMIDASGEILGFFQEGQYDHEKAALLAEKFNNKYFVPEDEFSPEMVTLKDQNNMAVLIDYSEMMSAMIVTIFVLAMSVVLWNAGLIGGLRRYGEVGVRLALGETKGHVFRSMINESFVIGIAGSILGTIIGLSFAFILQNKGFQAGDMMNDASLMMPSTFHARVTPTAYFIGFLPGVFSTVLGTSLSGIGIYKRNTSQLFKELES